MAKRRPISRNLFEDVIVEAGENLINATVAERMSEANALRKQAIAA